MNRKEKIDIIVSNVSEILSDFLDTKELSSSNEKMKKYYEDYQEFFENYQKNLPFDEIIKYENMMINYERGIGMSAFLLGFNTAMKISKGIDINEVISRIFTD